MDQGCRWIAVAVLPNGERRTGTFPTKSRMEAFVDGLLRDFPDAVIYYAIPSVVTRETRART